MLADTSIRPPTQIWDTALGRLQLQVPKPSFETWLRGTTGISYTNGEFTVEAPNAFVAEMLDQRMYSLICDSITMVVGERVSVKFEVAKEETPPSIDPRSSTSTRKAHSPVVQPSLTSQRLLSELSFEGALMNWHTPLRRHLLKILEPASTRFSFILRLVLEKLIYCMP